MKKAADIQTIKEKILNKSLLAFAFLSIPTLGTSLFRIYNSGWTNLFLFHISFVLLLWGLFLLRKKLSLDFKVCFLSFTGLLAGLLGAHAWGLIGGWLVLLTLPPVVFSLFYGKKFGLITIFTAGMVLSFIAFFDIDGSIVLKIDNVNGRATFFWVNTIVTYLFLTSPIVILIGETSNFLESYITKLKEKSEELERSKEYLSGTFDFLPVAIAIASGKGKMIKLNKKFKDMFGYDLDSIPTLDHWFNKAFPDDETGQKSKEQWRSCTKLALQHKTDLSPEIFVVTTANSDVLHVEVSFKLIKDNLVFAFKDFTARIEYEQDLRLKKEELKEQNHAFQILNKELEANNLKMNEINEKLIKAKRKAEESDRLKTYFLKNISHEIRTPLNGIMGFSEMLLQDNLSVSERELYSEFVNKSGQQFLTVLDNVVCLSELESGNHEVISTEINLPLLMREIEKTFSQKAMEKNINFRFEYPREENTMVIISDKKKINRVFSCLIENAIKFTDKGEVSFGYSVENDKEISFFVRDTGIGIPVNAKKNIFGRFMHGTPEIVKKYGGAGLGLAITKSVLELLGGSIKVDSKVDEGSIFTFRLPLTVPELKVVSED